MKTIKQILQQYQGIKRNNEIPIIIAQAIKKEKEFTYTHDEYQLSILEYLKFKYFLSKLKNNYPLSYITKNKEFFNIDFVINKNTLVPRPETEIMVEKTINTINKKVKNKILLIDVGTGSACIPISILKNINKKIKVIAIDISKKALKIAKINSRKYNTDIEFIHGNLLESVINNKVLQNYTDVIITANLPYITEEQFQNELSIQQEPKIALVAKKQGLKLYILLLQQIKEIKKIYPQLRLNILLEIDPSQAQVISKNIQKILPGISMQIIQDLTGKDRVVIIEK